MRQLGGYERQVLRVPLMTEAKVAHQQCKKKGAIHKEVIYKQTLTRTAHLDEVLDEAVVEILSSQVSVSSCGLDLEDALIDGQ